MAMGGGPDSREIDAQEDENFPGVADGYARTARHLGWMAGYFTGQAELFEGCPDMAALYSWVTEHCLLLADRLSRLAERCLRDASTYGTSTDTDDTDDDTEVDE